MEYKPSYADSLRADIQPSYSDSLYHHGILGMHWGVRRYQNPDGSLTPEGKIRYSTNYKKVYDTVTKRQLFSTRVPEHTKLQSTYMSNEAWNKITASPAYFRANQVSFPREYIESTTKKERKKETELAITATNLLAKQSFDESLDKHADILAKKFKLDINEIGVRDALRQALIDENGMKPTIESFLNYQPKQKVPENYRWKGLPKGRNAKI